MGPLPSLWKIFSRFSGLQPSHRERQYSKISENTDSDTGLLYHEEPSKVSRRTSNLLTLTAVWITTGALMLWLCFVISSHTYNDLLSQRDTKQPPRKYVHAPCGSTAEEATKRGCVFEVMSHCWIPPACSDESLDEEFLQNNWRYFLKSGSNEELTEIPLSEVRTGTHPGVHISFGNHITHCVYMQRKLQRATMRGGHVDSYIGNLAHAHHCGELVLQQAAGLPRDGDNGTKVAMPEWDDISDQAAIKFPACDDYKVVAEHEWGG